MVYFERGRQQPLAVFAYEFPHRKTQEFLKELHFCGFDNVFVFAAPKLSLNVDNGEYFPPLALTKASELTKVICERIGYSFCACSHDDEEFIGSVVRRHEIEFAIIAGARILPGSVIDLFSKGVLNFHPGMIPETSGLDALFYTIEKGIPAGVTAHLIDHRVDAGKYWRFGAVAMAVEDTLSVVSEKVFWKQVEMLNEFLEEAQKSNLDFCEIVRPKKNTPMGALAKWSMVNRFKYWLSSQLVAAVNEQAYRACCEDNVHAISRLRDKGFNVNCKIKGEWTSLVVAAFNHSEGVLTWLIDNGANVNYQNENGTTVLMYAKTKYLNCGSCSYPVLDKLISAGALVGALDKFSKSVIDYCVEFGDQELAAYFQARLI